jgi:hypothetical protein
VSGHGRCSTVRDCLSFIRVWLNDGAAPGGKILLTETVDWAATPRGHRRRNGPSTRPCVASIRGLRGWPGLALIGPQSRDEPQDTS